LHANHFLNLYRLNKILIIDDEEKIRTLLAKIISLEGFEVLQAADAKSGLKKLESADIDVVICDVKLPDASGVDLSKDIKKKYPEIEIILLTAYGNIPDSVQAIKNGAFDYITKGDDNNKIIPLVYQATEKLKSPLMPQQKSPKRTLLCCSPEKPEREKKYLHKPFTTAATVTIKILSR
jgi:two-component system NtrC family response regulator